MPTEPPTISPDDATLLQQFTATRSPAAFRQLVDRHLPAVHSAAQRILRDPHLAEDVTQSVFILLAQRAKKIRPGPLCGWLYQVTHYACANAQRTTRRRQQHEQEAAAMRPSTSTSPTLSDAEALLDPALLSLSAPERNILLLRYTADLPLAEIARLTCLPPETAKKRLHRALAKLRHYFATHGQLTAAPLALHALTPGTSAALLTLAPGVTAAALAPATASAATLAIAKGVTHLLHLINIAKISAVVAALIALLVSSTLILEVSKPTPPASIPTATITAAPGALIGTVHDPGGLPAPDILVERFYSDVPPAVYSSSTYTDAAGRFTFPVEDGEIPSIFIARSADGLQQAYLESPTRPADVLPQPRQLVLHPARQLPATVLDPQGNPVAGAIITALTGRGRAATGEATSDAQGKATLRVPSDAPLNFILAVKPGAGLDYFYFFQKDNRYAAPNAVESDFSGPFSFTLKTPTTVSFQATDDQKHPLAGVRVNASFAKSDRDMTLSIPSFDNHLAGTPSNQVTNDQGLATFDIFPTGDGAGVYFDVHKEGFATSAAGNLQIAYGVNNVNAILAPKVQLAGRVLTENGQPAADVTVRIEDPSHRFYSAPQQLRTKPDGSFAAYVNPDSYCLLIAQQGAMISPPFTLLVKNSPPAAPIELKLQPGLLVSGQLTAGPDHKIVPGTSVTLNYHDASYAQLPLDQKFPDDSRFLPPSAAWHVGTDSNGTFKFYAFPANFSISWDYDPSRASHALNVADQPALNFAIYSKYSIDTPPYFRGRVVLADHPQTPVPLALINRLPGQRSAANTEGVFYFTPRMTSDSYLVATSPDGKLGGIMQFHDSDDTGTIPISLVASVSGRLLDAGQPLAGRTITSQMRVVLSSTISRVAPHEVIESYSFISGSTAHTASDGTFALDGLIPGATYQLVVDASPNPATTAPSRPARGTSTNQRQLATLTPTSAQHITLGDISLPSAPTPRTLPSRRGSPPRENLP